MTDTPTLGIKGCTHVYAPKGRAGEYAELATNPYSGCGHGCVYCYVPGVLRKTGMTRAKFDAGAVEKKAYMTGLRRDLRKYQVAGVTAQVMLSFTTDAYPPPMPNDPDHLLTREILQAIADHGLAFCTLTKGGTRALRDLDLFRPDRDAFATTLTTRDDDFSRKWEPRAALPGDRLAALRAFHDAGIFTWVSLEPTLDVEASLAIVEATHPFVDLYKVGRANNVPTITRTTDWKDYTHRMIDALGRLHKRHYIKADLQEYLPPGYPNILRVPQHH